jgi:hypothetical protein
MPGLAWIASRASSARAVGLASLAIRSSLSSRNRIVRDQR